MGSEYHEDEWILANLPLPEKGFYLDVGCAHPEISSNTEFLRKRGWEGWAIDGNNYWRDKWQDVEGAKFIWSVIEDGMGGEVRFSNELGNYLARIATVGERRIATSLNGLYPPKVDFISLDIEGREYDALKWFDPKPPIIVSEYATEGMGLDFRVMDLLVGQGYEMVHQTKANMIFYKP